MTSCYLVQRCDICYNTTVRSDEWKAVKAKEIEGNRNERGGGGGKRKMWSEIRGQRLLHIQSISSEKIQVANQVWLNSVS